MKKVEAVIPAFKADAVRETLTVEKIARITNFDVKKAGKGQRTLTHYRGTPYVQDSTDFKVEIGADNDAAERIAELLTNTLRAGDLGEGEVVIVPIDHRVRLRVGQHCHGVSNANRTLRHFMRNRTAVRCYLDAMMR